MPTYITWLTGKVSMPFWESALAGVLFMALPLFVISILIENIAKFIIRKREKKRNFNEREQRLYSQYYKDLLSIQSKIQDISAQLKTTEVPVKYLYSYALDWMVDSINCKRANTLQEVINLYEQYVNDERRHQEMLEAQKQSNVTIYNEYYY